MSTGFKYHLRWTSGGCRYGSDGLPSNQAFGRQRWNDAHPWN